MINTDLVWCEHCQSFAAVRQSHDAAVVHYAADRMTPCPGSGVHWLVTAAAAADGWSASRWIPARPQPGIEREHPSAPMSPAPTRGEP